MKKIVFFLLIIFVCSCGFKNSIINNFPLFGRTIIIDPGHGSIDPGTVYNDLYEKDYNLIFSKSLCNTLEKFGANVVLTRTNDYDLSTSNSQRKRKDFNNRIKLINENEPDIYISLHMNYLSDATYYGSQVFYSNVNDSNELIAKSIQGEMNKFFGFNKDYRKIGDDKYMFKNIKYPGVLIEYGFMSNYKDRLNIMNEDYRHELALVILRGIINYFNIE